jgi:hypothetical protein
MLQHIAEDHHYWRTSMASSTIKPVKRDLPPKGDRNPDPITNEAGAHPIEAGIGAAVAGAATGMVAGLAAGPIGAAVGTIAGGVAGGLAGKAVGEHIDPTLEKQWFDEYYSSINDPKRTTEDYRDAYHYGLTSRASRPNIPFDQVEDQLENEWSAREGSTVLEWNDARPAVQHAWSRPVPAKTCNR